MSTYTAEYGYPNADLSVFSGTVHILPPKEGRTHELDDGTEVPQFTHDYALKADTILEYPGIVEDQHLRREIEQIAMGDDPSLSKDMLRRVGEHLAHDVQSVPCNVCGAGIWVDQWRGKYARNKCVDCAETCSSCGARNSYELHTRHASTRRANVFKCQECGNKKKGITTG